MIQGARVGATICLALAVVLLACCLCGFGETVNGYAVLMEVDAHPAGYGDIPIECTHIAWLAELLGSFGWAQNHILVREDAEVTQDAVIETIDWLAERVDSDDLVVFLVTGHGRFITNELCWNEIFPELWASVVTSNLSFWEM